MLGDSGGSSNYAALEARQAEERRQAEVDQAIARINAVFRGGSYGTGAAVPSDSYLPGQVYYDTFGRKYMAPGGKLPADVSPIPKRSYGVPQIPLYSGAEKSPGFTDDYFDKISGDYAGYYRPLVEEQYQNALRGLKLSTPSGGSSSYQRNVGALGTQLTRELVGVEQRGRSSADEARQRIEGTRADLVRAAETGASPDSVAAGASARASLANLPPVYEPLGDLFTRLAQTYRNKTGATAQGFDTGSSSLLFPGKRKTSGSVTTVGRA